MGNLFNYLCSYEALFKLVHTSFHLPVLYFWTLALCKYHVITFPHSFCISSVLSSLSLSSSTGGESSLLHVPAILATAKFLSTANIIHYHMFLLAFVLSMLSSCYHSLPTQLRSPLPISLSLCLPLSQPNRSRQMAAPPEPCSA